MNGALLSIQPRFAREILAGAKTSELRRRIPACEPGDLIIVYETSPTMAIVGTAEIKYLECHTKSGLWENVRESAGVTRREFREYFDGTKRACAIHLTEVKSLKRPISLSDMRELEPSFQPPQSWRYLDSLPKQLIAKVRRAAKA